MENNFKVTANKIAEFVLNPEHLDALDIVEEAKHKFHILHHNKAFQAELIKANFLQKEYTISIDSSIYKIRIDNELDQLISRMGFSEGNTKKLNQIKAPMPGIIIGIDVKVGDTIKEGDTLLILEAMKMENAIGSPKDGKVKAVHAVINDTVEKGKLLIELE